MRIHVWISAIFMVMTTQAVSCGGEVPVDRSGWPPVVRVGMVPVEGGADTRERFAPLETFLAKQLGVEVQVVSTSSYQGVITAMANQQLEFAYFGPKSYVEAAERASAEALVQELNSDGQPGYHAVFIVPKASTLKQLQDAKGLKFAYTDPNSTSGMLIPSMILYETVKQKAEDFFQTVRYSGSHGTSILQVAQGEIDLAATNDLDLARMIQKGAIRADDVRIIHKSELIPGSPFAARRDIPKTLKDQFVFTMLQIKDKKDLLERFAVGGYVPVDDSAYDIIRATEIYIKQKSDTNTGK